jgi:histidine ammonia-lyase
LAAAEGLEYRRPLAPGIGVKRAFEITRSKVERVERDRSLAPDIAEIAESIRQGEFEI